MTNRSISFCGDTAKISVFNMLCTVVLSVISVICKVKGGYVYPKPSITFELPHFEHLSRDINPLRQTLSDEIGKEISYSVEHDDYLYLKQYEKNQIHDTFLSSDNVVHPAQQNRIGETVQNPALTEQNHINVQQILDIENNAQLIRNHLSTKVIPNSLDVTGFQILNSIDASNFDKKLSSGPGNSFKIQNAVSFLKHDYIKPCGESEKLLTTLHSLNPKHSYQTQYKSALQSVVDVKRPSLRPVLNLQQALSGQNNIGTQFSAPQISQDPRLVSDVKLDSVSSIENSLLMQSNVMQNIPNHKLNVHNNVLPVITKQISFHIPPPDFEVPSVVDNIQPPTKVYKILFIRLPSHETKNTIQQTVEEKTIIYVLSKKPEPLQVDLTQKKVSEHKLFFVKYKGNPNVQKLIKEMIESLSGNKR